MSRRQLPIPFGSPTASRAIPLVGPIALAHGFRSPATHAIPLVGPTTCAECLGNSTTSADGVHGSMSCALHPGASVRDADLRLVRRHRYDQHRVSLCRANQYPRESLDSLGPRLRSKRTG